MKYQPDLPDVVKNIYDRDKYNKSIAYQFANSRHELYQSAYNLLIFLILIISGSLAALNSWSAEFTADDTWSVLLFFGVIYFGFDLLNLPFSIYKTFVIEQQYGFNRMTPGLFIADKIKGYLLAIFLGGSLLALFVMIYNFSGSNFWLYAWGTFAVVSILLSMFYASVILPIFNKLKPLENGSLRSEIETYCSKMGFRLNNLFVMDGSKRSSKANAFFSGLGSRKKIVLFDTLIQKHTNDELLAVLAHEVGHYKKKHTRKSLLISMIQMGLMLFLLSFFIEDPLIAQAFGSDKASFTLGLIGFSILYTPLSSMMGIALNLLSRKHEFEADRYAADTYGAEPLQSALKKLSADNLSNLTPHPWYVFFYYSHPPLIQRLQALSLQSK